MTEAPARVSAKTVVALLLFETLALIARSLLEQELDSRGITGRLGSALSYLVVPVILAFFCWPIVCRHRLLLRSGFSPAGLSLRLLMACVAAGILLRLAWWCLLVASIALGWVDSPGTAVVHPPTFRFACERPEILVAHTIALVVLAPIIEETINRGFLLRAFLPHGAAAAIVGSSALFAVFHSTGSMPMAFLFGLLAAPLALRTGSLWPSTVIHMTFNGLIIADWLCLKGRWTPPDTAESPMLLPGALGLALLVTFVALAVGILRRVMPGPKPTPAHPPYG